ncbi:MAG: AraC family transcriptional regulator [Lachnospiraceae bacterium]|nr:AraC family transcriptional regulator [Lachnospiraceae bacterium]
MEYLETVLKKELSIESIVSVHYFEYQSDFHFPGESHDFWEFCCVDKGEITITADKTTRTLHRGEIIFHQPGEFHALAANGKTAPNLVVMSFKTSSPMMDSFRNRILTVDERERNLLAQIIIESRRCFSTPLDNPFLQQLEIRDDAFFGSEQLIALYLEQLLVLMLRRFLNSEPAIPPARTIKNTSDDQLYAQVVAYLQDHIQERVDIEQICRYNLVGRSQLQRLFQKRNACGVINYFNHLKIEAGKQLIRENKYNFTQISEYLGYTSIHYFSRQFKVYTGMSPSEYANSIKVLSEK